MHTHYCAATVRRLTGLANSTISRRRKDAGFPEPVSIGGNRKAYVGKDVHRWIEENMRDHFAAKAIRFIRHAEAMGVVMLAWQEAKGVFTHVGFPSEEQPEDRQAEVPFLNQMITDVYLRRAVAEELGRRGKTLPYIEREYEYVAGPLKFGSIFV